MNVLGTSVASRAGLGLAAAAAICLLAAAQPAPAAATVECSPAKSAGRPCTSVAGPWVAVPPNGDLMTGNYVAYCPSQKPALEITGTDVVRKSYLLGTFLEQYAGESVYYMNVAAFWGYDADTSATSYQALIGCSPVQAGTARAAAAAARGPKGTHRVVERNVLPGRSFTHHATCRPGERLVRSRSGLLFYQRRPPSAAQLAAVTHRHSSDGKVRVTARGNARLLPPGKVRVQIHTVCR